ncbi:MAG: ammonia channel protein, partial [Nocardioidaceae bacterium]|nr:ammonia channel protein [Nocardioidaceae bacterium]
QLGKQAVAAFAVLAYSFILTFIIGKLIDVTIGFRVSEEVEVSGIDINEHLETAYDYAGTSAGPSNLAGGSHTAKGE